MNVWLKENDELLRGDLLLRWVQRSDLAPVPRTVEMTVRVQDDLEERLSEGAVFWTGREKLKYQIVKTAREPVALTQGADQLAAITVTALLHSCHQIAFRRQRAVIRENARFGELYRACGAEAPVTDDFMVSRFACFVGQVPSFHLAQALQEECGTLVLRDGRIAFVRLPDLFKQDAKTGILQTDASDAINSGFLERHDIPAYYSIGPDGAVVKDESADTRALQFVPFMDARTLRNMSRVLVTRRIIRSQLAQELNAGDCIEVMGKKFVIITAAHAFEQNAGMVESQSKFWVGDLNR